MDKRAGPVPEPISLERGEISRLPGWKFLHINTHKRASPVAGMKVQRYRHKLFLTSVKTISKQRNCPGNASGTKFSHINTREIHPAYRAVSLSGPARLPYKQILSLYFHVPTHAYIAIEELNVTPALLLYP
jgi:hypothetical protein